MRILVVEDNQDILVNIVDYLTLKGFVVDAMHNGAAALVQETRAYALWGSLAYNRGLYRLRETSESLALNNDE